MEQVRAAARGRGQRRQLVRAGLEPRPLAGRASQRLLVEGPRGKDIKPGSKLRDVGRLIHQVPAPPTNNPLCCITRSQSQDTTLEFYLQTCTFLYCAHKSMHA